MTRASFWNNPSAKDTHHVENDLPARYDARSQCGHDTPTDGTQHRFQNSECCAARHAGPRSTCRTRSKHERNRPNEPQSTTAMDLLIRFSDRLNPEGSCNVQLRHLLSSYWGYPRRISDHRATSCQRLVHRRAGRTSYLRPGVYRCHVDWATHKVRSRAALTFLRPACECLGCGRSQSAHTNSKMPLPAPHNRRTIGAINPSQKFFYANGTARDGGCQTNDLSRQ